MTEPTALIPILREVYSQNPEHFEFTVSPYICDKKIRATLLQYLTGDKQRKPVSSYYLTQVLRAKFNQITLF